MKIEQLSFSKNFKKSFELVERDLTRMADLRRQGKIGRIAMAGTNGTKYSAIRQHLKDQINRAYKEMDVSFDAFPNDDILSDPQAYLRGLDTMSPGDLVTIFTPDDTHFQIAYDAIERGLHVLLTKPPVKVLKEH